MGCRPQIAEVVAVMDKWGFSYVENLTWVHMAPNNTVVAAPSLYARRSHLSLFIFRKSGAPTAAHSVGNEHVARAVSRQLSQSCDCKHGRWCCA